MRSPLATASAPTLCTWCRALAPLTVATILYVAFLAGTQPMFSSDRPVVVNPTPMLYAVALIRTPGRFRAWLFPFVLVGTFAASALGGGGGDSLNDPVKLAGHAVSRAFGMLVFVAILDRLLPRGIDFRRPEHVVALAGAMIGSLAVRGLLLPLLTPASLLTDNTPVLHFMRALVPYRQNDLVGYGFGQAAGFLGLMTFTPPALVITGSTGLEPTSRRRRLQAAGLSLGLTAMAWMVLSQSDSSYLFLITAGLVAISFYTGFFGASVSVLALGFIALCVQLNSLRLGIRTVLDTETLTVQLFLATATVITLLVASALEQRRQLQLELERAKQVAEDTAAFKSRFLAVMSHEIRSPLASMTLLASALRRRTPADDESSAAVESIARVSGRVLDLLDGVLSYARVEAVGVAIRRSPTDVRALVRETVSTLEIQAVERGVALIVAGEEDVAPFALLDRDRVGQVLTNLISNAIRYSTTQVCVSHESTAADRVIFKICDDGAGMPAEAQASIFDPYYREAGAAQSGHVGLGLAISRELVDAMGGSIGVETGSGLTTMWFDLPAPAVTAAASAERALGE